MTDVRLKEEVIRILEHEEDSNPQAFVHSLKLHALVFSSNNEYPLHTDELSSCLESIIISSDLIDDIQDGEPHIKSLSDIEFGNSINLSITLLMLTLGKINNIYSRQIFDNILVYLIKALEGQYLDVNNLSETVEDYLNMVKLKSGSILAVANLLGASLSTSEYNKFIAEYSLCVGASAQIANDIKDVFNFDTKSDWKQKRRTLPILYLLNPEIKESKLIRDYYDGVISYEDFYDKREEVKGLLQQLGAIPFSIYHKHRLDKEARDLINQLVISDDHKSLLINKLLIG